MITVGVDPGIRGAIAFLQNGKYLNVVDMPIINKGSGSVKNEVNPSALLSFLKTNCPIDEDCLVALERVNAMPGQGVSSVFSLGDSFGCARSCIAACNYELTYVTPRTWKKHFNLTSDKEQARAAAVKMFPQASTLLHLKKHADRAEALLMARWLHDLRY
jgi:crossover junction endodeoxyribonuclease RuvC|tara:strand:- start:306 stop:785 length:480 start_codon:yes stop_codon:yes gene_type:complete